MLADPQVLERADQFRDLSVEYARLLPTATALQEYRRLESELESAELLRADADPAMRALGEEEAARLRAMLAASSEALQRLLLPHDPHDEGNIFLEIRAGTGGDEAAIFAGRLAAHVQPLCREPQLAGRVDQRESAASTAAIGKSSAGWSVAAPSPDSNSSRVPTGCNACRPPRRRAEFTPRPARWPSCRSWPRSIASTSILPICASTPTAPRARAGSTSTRPTRRCASPTCPPASWWNARTNVRNTRTAHARCRCCRHDLLAAEQEKRASAQAQTRKLQVGSGDRSERIRTYNFPQGRHDRPSHQPDALQAGGHHER